MNTPKHTPGPWVSTGPHTREVVTYNTSTYRPAMTIATVSGYWDGEALANMHLIAAAPAMYEALSGMVSMYDSLNKSNKHVSDCPCYHCKARAALAQAEAKS